jgi:DNA invertase Pin-like site-specific DNA recombinase
MEKTLRVAAYPRVSSTRQADAGSIQNQNYELPQAIARHKNWQLVRPIDYYADDGKSASSGKLIQRVGFSKLLRDVRNGELDLVVVADFDRITRAEDLEERGFILGTFQKGPCLLADTGGQVLDLNSMEGDLIAGMRTSQSADYVRKLRKRVREGHDRAIRDGRKPRGPTPFGLVFKRDAKLGEQWSTEPVGAAVLVEIFERICKRESYIDIARDFRARDVPTSISRRDGVKGVWSREKVHKMVDKTYLRGEWVVRSHPRTVIAVPAIISEALWKAAHAVLATYGRRGLVKRSHEYVSAGLLYCSLCGSRFGISRGFVDRTTSYICMLRRKPNEKVTPHVRCTMRRIPQKYFDDQLWEFLRAKIRPPGELEAEIVKQRQASGVRDWTGELRERERELGKLEENEVVLMERLNRGLISQGAMDKMLAKMAVTREELTSQIKMARAEAASTPGRSTEVANAVIAKVRMALSLPTELSTKMKEAFVKAIVEKIVVKEDGRADVYYNTRFSEASLSEIGAT